MVLVFAVVNSLLVMHALSSDPILPAQRLGQREKLLKETTSEVS